MKTMSRLSAAERRQQNVGSRASAAARGHGRACRRCDINVVFHFISKLVFQEVLIDFLELSHDTMIVIKLRDIDYSGSY